jgi:hypothetical protein
MFSQKRLSKPVPRIRMLSTFINFALLFNGSAFLNSGCPLSHEQATAIVPNSAVLLLP